MSVTPIVFKRRKTAPKTRDCDEMCFPGYHVFNDTGAGLVHPYWTRDTFLPVEFCVHCGLIRIKLQEPNKDKSDEKSRRS